MKNFLSIFFAFWLTVFPFLYWQGFYEEPKVLFFLIGVIVLNVYWIVRIFFKFQFRPNKADLFFLAWIFVLTISSVFGVHAWESIVGGSYRHQGVLFFFGLWVTGITVRYLSQKSKKIIVKILALSALVQTLIIAVQTITGNLYFGRPLGTLGEPNAIAGYLLLSSYFILVGMPKLFLAINLLGIILTKSRIGIISSVLTLPVKNFQYFLFLITLALGSSFLIQRNNSYYENRISFLKSGFEAVSERPFLGYGAESGEFVYQKIMLRKGIKLAPLIIDRSHNLFIDTLLWSGVVGFVFFAGWLLESFKKMGSEKRFVFLSFMLYSMLQPISVVHWVILFILLNI